MKKNLAVDIICCLFILLFLYTGLIKILDHTVFLNALRKSPLLKSFALLLSIVVPLLELMIAVSLLIPKIRRRALYGFLVMMSIFTLYIGYMLYFRSDLPCTCGGIIQQMNWHQHLYFNAAFTFLTIFTIWLDKKIETKEYQATKQLIL